MKKARPCSKCGRRARTLTEKDNLCYQCMIEKYGRRARTLTEKDNLCYQCMIEKYGKATKPFIPILKK